MDDAVFGINIKEYVKNHERYIIKYEESEIDDDLLNLHLMKLKFLQHERLVHLIVTFMTLMITVIMLGISVLSLNVVYLVLFLVLLTLSTFYLMHYFFLENHVQYWYIITESLTKSIKKNCGVNDEDI